MKKNLKFEFFKSLKKFIYFLILTKFPHDPDQPIHKPYTSHLPIKISVLNVWKGISKPNRNTKKVSIKQTEHLPDIT